MIAQPRGWQPFVNFWMDWMWRENRQSNYLKLALVMMSIADRENHVFSQIYSFEQWCQLAKQCQENYFSQH